MQSAGRTIILVTIVSVLIWIFAEGESLRSEDMTVDVTLSPGSESRLIEPGPGQPWTGSSGSVKVRVEGSTAAIDELRQALRSPVALVAGLHGMPRDPGEHDIDLRDILRSTDPFRRSGVTVAEVEPPRLLVRLDTIRTVELPVRVVAPEGEIDGVPEPSPSKVTVRLPGSAATRLGLSEEPDAATDGNGAASKVTMEARLDRDLLLRLTPNRREVLPNVPVVASGDLAGVRILRIDPPAVSVALTLRSKEAEVVVATVPVYPSIPAVVSSEYLVEIAPEDRFVQDVRVRGPVEMIEQIRSGQTRLVGLVVLTPEDLDLAVAAGQAGIERPVVFTMLPTRLEFRVEHGTVVVRARRLEPEEGAGGPREPEGNP